MTHLQQQHDGEKRGGGNVRLLDANRPLRGGAPRGEEITLDVLRLSGGPPFVTRRHVFFFSLKLKRLTRGTRALFLLVGERLRV